jgi:hypothetical protein
MNKVAQLALRMTMMRKMKRLVMLIAAVGIATAALGCTAAAGAPATGTALGSSAWPPGSTLDFFYLPSLSALSQKSDVIIQGHVLDAEAYEQEATRGIAIQGSVTQVQITRVLKGNLNPGETLSVHQFPTNSPDYPPLPSGKDMVLFLNTIDPGVSPPPLAADFFSTVGPQGRFLIEEGKIRPMGPENLETTKLYRGLPSEAFTSEIMKTLATGNEG